MANHVALFQLGMDLASSSSTAQTEEHDHRAAPHEEQRKDFFIERNGVRFAGTHLLIDLYEAEKLDDVDLMERALRECVTAAGATLLHINLHHFEPNGGVSGVAVLSESHISVHSWPEVGYAAFDVFMCGAARPHEAVGVLQRHFQPGRVVVKEHMRGEEGNLWNDGSRKTCTTVGAPAIALIA
ncbi:MAG: adenosylmethionine decarboxylase [Rhizobiales bacterium]|nr:adenosylmethionine decarboxylase [Hyphomicrobiales bacterium]